MIGIELDMVDEGTGAVEETITVVGTVVTAVEVVGAIDVDLEAA